MPHKDSKKGREYNFRALEQIVKGFANHRRIQIMALLAQQPELSIGDISDKLRVNIKTVSAHVRRLANAGLVTKRYQGPTVLHTVTRRGIYVLKFLRTLE